MGLDACNSASPLDMADNTGSAGDGHKKG